MDIIFFFVFVYPLFMAIFWMMGSLTYYFRREHQEIVYPESFRFPTVAIVIPCHNEEVCIEQTLRHLAGNHYPGLEIIAVNDGSSDRTAGIMRGLVAEIPNFKVIELSENRGKAVALTTAAKSTSAEYIMCVDADSLLDHKALYWMIWHLETGPRVGAVTGNPRIINRDSLISRIQIGEFASIIGMIKRSQRNIGRLFTVSGVDVCYRKQAVEQAGYWLSDTATEDVDISWRLQLNHWDIRYEPNALSWILVPDNIKSLWRQRLRWAKGGLEAALRYSKDIFKWHSRRMWPVYAEYWLGVTWAYCFLLNIIAWLGSELLGKETWPQMLWVEDVLPGWTGVLLASVCLMQFVVGLNIDKRYEKTGMLRYLYWAIWYPAIYWMINAATTVVAVAVGLLSKGKRPQGTWKSPRRQLRSMKEWMKDNNDTTGSFMQSMQWLMTTLFWGVWIYLMIPLLSLALWLGGIYLFTDRMIRMGGYQSLMEQLLNYSIVIAVMAAILAGWILFNYFHYGRHDRRNLLKQRKPQSQQQRASQDAIQNKLNTERYVLLDVDPTGVDRKIISGDTSS